MKRILFYTFMVMVMATKSSLGQEYITEGKKRLNFAKTYFEIGGQYSPGFSSKKMGFNQNVQPVTNPASIVPYVNIGGFHFWGHADFFISIPLSQINLAKSDNAEFTLSQSVVTGARFLPWAYKDNKIRPYLGASWVIVNSKQENKQQNGQPVFSKSKLILDGDLLYGKGSFMTRVGVNIYPNTKLNYPIAQTKFEVINTPNWSAYLGLVYAFESTRSKNMETENARLNKYPLTSSPKMNATKNADWFIGVGPSTSFILANSNYNHEVHPYFNKKPISNSFVDISFGYQFNKKGIVTALSYRNPKFANEAFGTKQTFRKSSIVLEAYKFLIDYSGFTPYIGLNVAFDKIQYDEKSSAENISFSKNIVTPGFTFGWDILPGKTAQPFVLRTNLRWFPFERFDVNNSTFSLKQIEYNVIQAVFYPSRFKDAKRKRD